MNRTRTRACHLLLALAAVLAAPREMRGEVTVIGSTKVASSPRAPERLAQNVPRVAPSETGTGAVATDGPIPR